MDIEHKKELCNNYYHYYQQGVFYSGKIYVFGHTDASIELIKLFQKDNIIVQGILDNNKSKCGTYDLGVEIIPPYNLNVEKSEDIIVCIVLRAYASMNNQLISLGFKGKVLKLLDYNTFSEYSLSTDVIKAKWERMIRGKKTLDKVLSCYCNHFIVICPFNALGDVYYAMSFLDYYKKINGLGKIAIVVVGESCANVVALFNKYPVVTLTQFDMDEFVQAVMYLKLPETFIVHHDRPYSNYSIRLLKYKLIPFVDFYRIGIYGLSNNVLPVKPKYLGMYNNLESIPKGKSVIVSPYAKSIINLPMDFWCKIVKKFIDDGYKVFSNLIGDEKPIDGTIGLRDVKIQELQSLVEYAGSFLSLRSGLCDVLLNADCRKIAIYPDKLYSDTKWKVVDFFYLDGWENVVVDQRGELRLYERNY